MALKATATKAMPPTMEAQPPPHDLLAEGGILSAIINQYVPACEVKAIVKSEDFYFSRHQAIATALYDLDSRGEPTDLVSVCSRLKATGQLQAAGGADYVTRLMDNCPVSTDHLHHARIVRDKATLRRIIENCNAAIRAGFEGRDTATVLRPLRANLDKIVTDIDSGRPSFAFVSAGELTPKKPEYLIRGILERNSICTGYGDPESYKSFLLAIDAGCCVAAKVPFHGHQIDHDGPVVCICGEGRDGIGRRVKAWCIRNGVDMASLNFHVSTMPAGLTDPEQLSAVKSALDALARDRGAPVLIVIDTLARCFGPGDENSTKDMTAFVSALDNIRCAYGASIIIIHHTGHMNKDRARGAMALRAAVDTEYRIERDPEGVIRMICTKSKDGPRPEPMAFRPAVVDLGILDDHREPVTSVVLDDAEYIPAQRTGHEGKGKWQKVAVDTLRDLLDHQSDNLVSAGYDPDGARVTFDDWRNACIENGIPNRSAFWKAKESLAKLGTVVVKDGFAELQ